MYTVEVTTVSDDYKRPEADSTVYFFNSLEEAREMAVIEVVEQIHLYSFAPIEDDNEAVQLLARGDVNEIWSWYLEQDNLFTGEFVPETFSVSIRQKEPFQVPAGKLELLVDDVKNHFGLHDLAEEAA